MDFGAAIKSGFRNYATFRGRASRSEFWWWAVFEILSTSAAGLVDAALGTTSQSGGLLQGLLGLVLLLPGLAVTVRRLHDTGHSGWWYWISFTIIGFVFPLLIWFCRHGEEHPNAYGEDPLATDARMILPGAPNGGS